MIVRISVTRKGLKCQERFMPHVENACVVLSEFLSALDLYFTFGVARVAGKYKDHQRLKDFFDLDHSVGKALFAAFKETGSRITVNMYLNDGKDYVIVDLFVYDNQKNVKFAVQLEAYDENISVIDMRF